jgi:hypothetical protein
VLHGITDPESLKAIPLAEPAAEDAQAADLRERLEKHMPLIGAVVAAAGQPELRSQLDPALEEMQQPITESSGSNDSHSASSLRSPSRIRRNASTKFRPAVLDPPRQGLFQCRAPGGISHRRRHASD